MCTFVYFRYNLRKYHDRHKGHCVNILCGFYSLHGGVNISLSYYVVINRPCECGFFARMALKGRSVLRGRNNNFDFIQVVRYSALNYLKCLELQYKTDENYWTPYTFIYDLSLYVDSGRYSDRTWQNNYLSCMQ